MYTDLLRQAYTKFQCSVSKQYVKGCTTISSSMIVCVCVGDNLIMSKHLLVILSVGMTLDYLLF